jgi:hypothetical protein
MAWATILVLSDLPEVLWDGLAGVIPPWLSWSMVSLLAGLLFLSTVWPRLRALGSFALIFLILLLALHARDWVGKIPWWQARFAGETPSFTRAYRNLHVRDVIVAVVVLAGPYLLTRQRSAFYLARGQTDAPVEPVRWLGIRRGESWRTFAWIFTLSATLAVLVVLATSVPLNGAALLRAGPLLPIVVLLAAMNVLAEEAYYPCSHFGTLHSVVGTQLVLLMNTVQFGMAHDIGGFAAWRARRAAHGVPGLAAGQGDARNALIHQELDHRFRSRRLVLRCVRPHVELGQARRARQTRADRPDEATLSASPRVSLRRRAPVRSRSSGR